MSENSKVMGTSVMSENSKIPETSSSTLHQRCKGLADAPEVQEGAKQKLLNAPKVQKGAASAPKVRKEEKQQQSGAVAVRKEAKQRLVSALEELHAATAALQEEEAKAALQGEAAMAALQGGAPTGTKALASSIQPTTSASEPAERQVHFAPSAVVDAKGLVHRALGADGQVVSVFEQQPAFISGRPASHFEGAWGDKAVNRGEAPRSEEPVILDVKKPSGAPGVAADKASKEENKVFKEALKAQEAQEV